MGSSQAYCTLLYNDAYLPGALVLGQALRDYGTERSLIVLVGSQVSEFAVYRLNQVFDQVIPTETIANSQADAPQFKLLGRPELERSYTKIHVWRQLQFDRIVFLDADTLPLQNLDSLFSLTDGLDSSIPIAASPDIGWPDVFNSGVFVTTPSYTIYNSLVGRARAGLSFDGGDQGLLNQFFEDRWQRLPFTYNVTPSASYQYTPAYQYFKDSVNVVHFIGSNKPWSNSFTGPWHNSSEFEVQWWNIYNRHYDSQLNLKPAYVAPEQNYQHSTPEQDYQHSAPRQDYQHSAPQQDSHASAPQHHPHYEHQHDQHHEHHIEQQNEQHAEKPTAVHELPPHLHPRPYQPPAPEPTPAYIPPVTVEADINHWDATRYQPPRDSKPEAANLVIEHYQNAWDAPPPAPEQQNHEAPPPAEPHHQPKEEQPKQSPVYYAPAPHSEPIKPIFPWEFSGTVAAPERVFPDESEYEEEESDEEQEEEENEKPENTEERTADQEPEEEPEEDPEEEHGTLSIEPTIEVPTVTREFRDYSVGPDSQDGMRVNNVWDSDPKIQRYVNQSIRAFGFRPFGYSEQEEDDSENSEEGQDDDDSIEQDTGDEDVDDAIEEAERELAANAIVHKKIASENDSGIIMKRPAVRVEQPPGHVGKGRVFPVTPNPIKLRERGFTGGLSDASDVGDTETVDEEEEEEEEEEQQAEKGNLTKKEEIEEEDEDEKANPSKEKKEEKVQPETKAADPLSEQQDDDNEEWDPHAKLAELAELSALIAAKQMEFEKKYEEKFGKVPKKIKRF